MPCEPAGAVAKLTAQPEAPGPSQQRDRGAGQEHGGRREGRECIQVLVRAWERLAGRRHGREGERDVERPWEEGRLVCWWCRLGWRGRGGKGGLP